MMRILPIRVTPGQDLRLALEAQLSEHAVTAGFVLQGIGSLSTVALRLAGRPESAILHGDYEVLSLAGSLSLDGAHLHAAVADATGRVIGGHVAHGCIVRTTAELLVVLMPEHRFTRTLDHASGWQELVIGPASGPA